MSKSKVKTLRKVHKLKLQKGGQVSMDYKENFDFFLDSMKQLKEEKEKIDEEGELLYSQETQEKHKLIDNSIIVKFNEELISKANVLETTITAFLETTTSEYASIFLKNLSNLQNLLNETNDLVIFSQNIQKELNSKKIHIHLIQTFINLFDSLKIKINSIQEKFEKIKSEIEKTINKLKEKKISTINNPSSFEYVARLSKEDTEVLGVQFVKGDIIFQNDEPKHFIPKNEFIKTIVDLSNNEGYYTTSDNKTHQVKISPINLTSTIRDVQTKTNYYLLINEKDQILSGVKYILCDKNGSILFENKKPIPFFPNYLELAKENSNFIQLAPNKVDTITYVFIKQLDESLPILHVVNEAKYDSLINPLYSNFIDIFYKNKYLEINVDTYVAPFVLCNFLLNSGDFFVIHNSSKLPIIFNISKTSDDKRVILYPNQIVCFVYSERSELLQYGYLLYKIHEVSDTTSNIVAKISTTNDYIFMSSQLIEDKKEVAPLLDSQKKLIKVPNFDLSGSLYYDIDDYFNKDPIQVSIIDPIQLNEIIFSYEYSPVITNFICLIQLDIFVFCDENGVPVLNTYGYFQPLITPIHFSNDQYFYYLENEKKYVVMKEKKDILPNVEESYGIVSQNVSPYSVNFKETQIFSDSLGNPITYNKSLFGKVPVEYSTKLLPNNMFNLFDSFNVLEYNLEERKDYISLYYLHNIIEIYRNQTKLIYTHFKDLSGNINNLGSLLLDFEMIEKQLNTTKKISLFQDIQSTYDKVKELYKNLNNINKIKSDKINNLNNLNEIKLDKINLLTPLEIKLQEIKEKIVNIQDPNELNHLFSTVNKLDQTINIVKNNISSTEVQSGGGNGSDYLESQDVSIQIVKAGLDILEKNLNSSLKSIQNKKTEESEKLLKEKQDTLLGMDKTILDEINTVNHYNSMDEYYMSRAPMDHEDEFNKYHTNLILNIKTIQSIIDKVQSGKSFETPKQITAETVDTITSERSSNLQLIEATKKNTKELFKKMDLVIEEANKNELNRLKKDLLNLINDFENQHKNIEILNNKLKLKQFYDINSNLIEVKQIKDDILTPKNKDILKDSYTQVYNVFLREKDILNELQTKELTIVGGSKKRTLRKVVRINKSRKINRK